MSPLTTLLLQAAISLLLLVQANPNLNASLREQAITVAQQAIQIATHSSEGTQIPTPMTFTATPTSGVAPLRVTFSVPREDIPVDMNIFVDYGDGTGSNKLAPSGNPKVYYFDSHTYTSVGTYKARLFTCSKGTNTCEGYTILGTETITVNPTSAQTGTTTVVPTTFVVYLDEPLDSVPTTPLSGQFLLEHRTALNGKIVTIQGFVVSATLGPNACAPEVCQPSIRLADTTNDDRNKDYDTFVQVSEQDIGYRVGQFVLVKGTVTSSKVTAYLTKSY